MDTRETMVIKPLEQCIIKSESIPLLLTWALYLLENKEIVLSIPDTLVSHQVDSIRAAPAEQAFYNVAFSYHGSYRESSWFFLHVVPLVPFARCPSRYFTRLAATIIDRNNHLSNPKNLQQKNPHRRPGLCEKPPEANANLQCNLLYELPLTCVAWLFTKFPRVSVASFSTI